jgi:hypothetical protein
VPARLEMSCAETTSSSSIATHDTGGSIPAGSGGRSIANEPIAGREHSPSRPLAACSSPIPPVGPIVGPNAAEPNRIGLDPIIVYGIGFGLFPGMKARNALAPRCFTRERSQVRNPPRPSEKAPQTGPFPWRREHRVTAGFGTTPRAVPKVRGPPALSGPRRSVSDASVGLPGARDRRARPPRQGPRVGGRSSSCPGVLACRRSNRSRGRGPSPSRTPPRSSAWS